MAALSLSTISDGVLASLGPHRCPPVRATPPALREAPRCLGRRRLLIAIPEIEDLLQFWFSDAGFAETQLLTLEHARVQILDAVGGVCEPLGEAVEEGSEEAAGEAGLMGCRCARRREVFEFEVELLDSSPTAA
jgi:hypothetical protein